MGYRRAQTRTLFEGLVKDKSTVMSGNVGHSVLHPSADFSSPDPERDQGRVRLRNWGCGFAQSLWECLGSIRERLESGNLGQGDQALPLPENQLIPRGAWSSDRFGLLRTVWAPCLFSTKITVLERAHLQ